MGPDTRAWRDARAQRLGDVRTEGPRNFRAEPDEPGGLPPDAEQWAAVAERVPALLGLHLRSAALRRRRLADRPAEWPHIVADLRALHLPQSTTDYALRLFRRSGLVPEDDQTG